MKYIRQKMGFISESRKEFGLALNLPIRVNITHAGMKTIFPSGIVDVRRERRLAEEYRRKLRMATPDVERDVKALSGGTQQKVVLAKWLSTDSEFLVFDVPEVGRFGVLNCYDMWFPETSRQVTAMGAEVILHPVLTHTIDRDVDLAVAHATSSGSFPSGENLKQRKKKYIF
jgi:predicted amidohydrolase